MSQKISNLPAVIAATIQDTDIMPLVASNVTSKVTIANLRTKLGTQPPAGGRTVTDAFTYLTNNAVFNVKDFGAFGDGATNDTAAIQLAITQAQAVRGGVVYLPPGTYKITSTLTITVNGISFVGAGGHTAGAIGTKPTAIDASTIATGLDAITAIGPGAGTMKQIKFRGFYLEMLAPSGQVGGAGIKVQNASGLDIRDVAVYVPRGTTSVGVQLGHLTDGTKAVIASSLDNVTSVSDGTPFQIGTGSTSIHGRNCYALGQSVAGYHFKGTSYCSLNSCAADTGTSTGYGYKGEATTGLSLIGCGAENNGKGFFLGSADIGTSIISSRGVGNNTSADTAIGDFAELTGVGYGTSIVSCASTSPNAATTKNIHGGAGRLDCVVSAYNLASNFSKGIGGDAGFVLSYLTTQPGDLMTVPSLTVNQAAAFGLVTTNGQTELIAGFNAAGGNALIATLNANRTVAAPTGMVVGQRVTFTIIQDGTGGRTLAWNAVFKVSWSDAGNTLNKRSSISFIWDGTNWNQDGAQTPYV